MPFRKFSFPPDQTAIMTDNIFYNENGSGQPVVFIHGFCETHKIWNQIAGKLVHSFRVITLDLPGFGESKLLPSPFSLQDIADEIHDLLTKLNIGNPVIIGHSLGGYVTLSYVKRYKSELKGFGLFHSHAYLDAPDKKENRTKLIEFIKKNGVEPFVKSFIPSLFYEQNRTHLQDVINELTREALKTPGKTIQEYARAMRDREENIELLMNYQKPVMMIIGENDGSIPLEKSIEQSKMLQRPYILTLKETGHMGMFERPVETFNFLHNFLNVC